MFLMQNIHNLAKCMGIDEPKFKLLVVSGECIWEEISVKDWKIKPKTEILSFIKISHFKVFF